MVRKSAVYIAVRNEGSHPPDQDRVLSAFSDTTSGDRNMCGWLVVGEGVELRTKGPAPRGGCASLTLTKTPRPIAFSRESALPEKSPKW